MLLAVSAFVALTFFNLAQPPWDIVVFGLAFSGFVFGLLQSVLVHSLKVDRNGRTFTYSHGFGKIASEKTGSLEGATLRVEEKMIRNIYGEPRCRSRIILETSAGEIAIVPVGASQVISDLAIQLSELMGIRINRDPVPFLVPATKAQKRTVLAVIWLSLCSVMVIAIVPSLKRKPATTPNVASGFGIAVTFDYATNRGIMYLNDKQYPQTEKSFREAILQKHNLPQAYNYLAYAYLYQNKLTQALEAAVSAQKEAPKDANIADTVGEMYENNGNLKVAVKCYKNALQLAGSNPAIETNFKLGRTLVTLKRIKDAEPYLQSAAQYPKFEYGGQASDLLDRLKIPIKRRKTNYPAAPGLTLTPNT